MTVNMWIVDATISHPAHKDATRAKNRYAVLAISSEHAVKLVEHHLLNTIAGDVSIEKVESRGPQLGDILLVGMP